MLGRPGTFRTSQRFLADLRLVRNLDGELTGRGAFHLHAGSGAWPVEIRIVEPAPSGGAVLLRSRDPIALHSGDRFILRETGRRAVIGGGSILDPDPPHRRPEMRDAVPMLRDALRRDPDAIADTLLAVRGTARLDELYCDSGGGTPSSTYRAGKLVMAGSTARELHRNIVGALSKYHRENRLRPGMPKAALSSTLRVDPPSAAALIAGSDEIVDDGATIRLGNFSPGLSNEEQRAWDAAKSTLRENLAVPRASQLGLDQELLHALERAGHLVRVSDDLVYLPAQLETISRRLPDLPPEFTVAEFRDLLGVTRRQAIPLLEWYDKQGTTTRRGDVRSVRRI
jgi:selenocysteine-specific elongation factor